MNTRFPKMGENHPQILLRKQNSYTPAEALKHRELRNFLAGEGFELDGAGPAAFAKFLDGEIAKYIALIPAIDGLKVE